MHWIIADKTGASVTVESTAKGLNVYDNPVGVLTNNPEFPRQLLNLSNYRSVAPANPANVFAPDVDLPVYSRGLGTHFLPGEWILKVVLLRLLSLRCMPQLAILKLRILPTTSTFFNLSNNKRDWMK